MTFLQTFEPTLSAFGEQMVTENTSSFHVNLSYSLRDEIVAISETLSGTVTHSNNEGVVSTGTNAAGEAYLSSKRALRYLTGVGGEVMFQGRFTTGVANSEQGMGIIDQGLNDGFVFGYDGTDFALWRRQGGTTFNKTLQASWNVDPMDGTGPSGHTLDPTKGNVYKIVFQWLGGGDIFFYVEAARGTGQRGFALVHVIEYAGTGTGVSIDNPSLPITAYAKNTGSTTDISVYCPSMKGSVQGRGDLTGLPRSYDVAFSNVGGAEDLLFQLRNKTTFQGIDNRVEILITSFGGSSYDNQASTLGLARLILNPTSTGGPAASYSDFDTSNSVAEIDTSASSRTGGIQVESLPFRATADSKFDIENQRILLSPGDVLAVTGDFTANSDFWVHLSWRELF